MLCISTEITSLLNFVESTLPEPTFYSGDVNSYNLVIPCDARDACDTTNTQAPHGIKKARDLRSFASL